MTVLLLVTSPRADGGPSLEIPRLSEQSLNEVKSALSSIDECLRNVENVVSKLEGQKCVTAGQGRIV